MGNISTNEEETEENEAESHIKPRIRDFKKTFPAPHVEVFSFFETWISPEKVKFSRRMIYKKTSEDNSFPKTNVDIFNLKSDTPKAIQ